MNEYEYTKCSGCGRMFNIDKPMEMVEFQEHDCETNDEFFEEDGDWMDGDALASAGWGTDEDYGHFGDDF
jgi:hypothetical protein